MFNRITLKQDKFMGATRRGAKIGGGGGAGYTYFSATGWSAPLNVRSAHFQAPTQYQHHSDRCGPHQHPGQNGLKLSGPAREPDPLRPEKARRRQTTIVSDNDPGSCFRPIGTKLHDRPEERRKLHRSPHVKGCSLIKMSHGKHVERIEKLGTRGAVISKNVRPSPTVPRDRMPLEIGDMVLTCRRCLG